MEGKPMLLVSFKLREDNEYDFEIEPTTLRFLHSYRENVTIVGIIGKYRSGKSFLMNQLIPQKDGFEVDSGIAGKTQGIWVNLVTHPTKRNKKLLLIDTEGFSDAKRKNKDSEKICVMFCLAMCDRLIVNVHSVIDESILETMGILAEIYNVAIVEENRSLPHVTVAVRDFTFSLVISGRKITSDEYLVYILDEKEEDDSEFSKVRQSFKSLFKNRNCITFGFPCEVDELGNLSKIKSPIKLRSEFSRKVNDLKQQILECDGKYTARAFAEKVRPHIQTLCETMEGLEVTSGLAKTEMAVVTEWIRKSTDHFECQFEEAWEKAWEVASGYKRPGAGRQKTREMAEDSEIPAKFKKCVETSRSDTLRKFGENKLNNNHVLEDALDRHETKFVEQINEESMEYFMKIYQERLRKVANCYTFNSLADTIGKDILLRFDNRLIYGKKEEKWSTTVNKMEMENMKFEEVDKSNHRELEKKLMKVHMNWDRLSLMQKTGTVVASSLSGAGTAFGATNMFFGTIITMVAALGTSPISIPAALIYTGGATAFAATNRFIGNKVLTKAGEAGRGEEKDEFKEEEKKSK